MNKKIVWTVVIIVIIGIIFWTTGKDSSVQTNLEEPIKMGVLIPLTGSGADQGEWVEQGLKLALAEVNASLKTKIELIFQDTKGDPKTAISTYNQIKSQFVVPAILTWGSGVGVALTPIVNEDEVIQMGVGTAADSYTTADDFTFRVFPSASQEATFLAGIVKNKLDIKDVIILNINNDYGVSSAKAFGSAFEKEGGGIMRIESYETGTTDFRTLLTKIKALSPKLVYLASYPTDGALILRQAKDLGVGAPFVASTAILGGKDFFKTAGDAAEGLMIVNSAPPFSDISNPEIQHFTVEYNKSYSDELGPQHLYVSRAYDALKILAQAVEVCGPQTECIRQYLFAMKDYRGVSGSITFDRNGDISSRFNLQIVKNGQFVEIK